MIERRKRGSIVHAILSDNTIEAKINKNKSIRAYLSLKEAALLSLANLRKIVTLKNR